jgi:hypothetical protein
MLTILMLVLLSLQVAVISLVAIRGLGEEGMAVSQKIQGRQAAETAIARLTDSLRLYLLSNTGSQAEVAFAQGGSSAINNTVLTADNPDSGSSNTTPVTISAWLSARRGYYYHLVGRAVNGSMDLMVHRWVYLNPCRTQGRLITILSDRDQSSSGYPAYTYPSLAVAPNGSVVVGEAKSAGKIVSWSSTGGLSVLLSGIDMLGFHSTIVDSNNRFFFGGNDGKFYTWKDGAGLSVLVTGALAPGYDSVAVASDDRLFFGSWYAGSSLWSWKSNVLTTIVPSGGSPGADSLSVAADNDRLYFNSSGNAYTWKSDTGLSTVRASSGNPLAGWSDTAYVLNGSSPYKLYQWKANGTATGMLSLIINNLESYNVTKISPLDGRLFVGTFHSSGWTTDCWTWKNGVGLTTIALGGQGCDDFTVTPSGKMVIGGWTNNVWVWDADGTASGSLSTILTNAYVPRGFVVGDDGRVYFTETTSPARVWTWVDNSSTGILSILMSADEAGNDDRSIQIAGNGRVFIGEATTPGAVWTWKPGNSLITIVTGKTKPGYGELGVSGSAGSGFFGDYASPGGFWSWEESSCQP